MDHADASGRQPARYLKQRADDIASLIVASDFPAIDVALAIARLKEFCAAELPGREGLFEMVYGSRFRRLWQQWRPDSDGELPQW